MLIVGAVLSKRKIKLSLIQDYGALNQVAALCRGCLDAVPACPTCQELAQRLQPQCQKLKVIYQQVLLKIGSVDLAFALFEQDWQTLPPRIGRDTLHNETWLLGKLGAADMVLSRLRCELVDKLRKLAFNDFEIALIQNFA